MPGASVDFDFSEQKLTLSVPQNYMRNAARGYVPPEMWQTGVNAGFVSYNANAYPTLLAIPDQSDGIAVPP